MDHSSEAAPAGPSRLAVVGVLLASAVIAALAVAGTFLVVTGADLRPAHGGSPADREPSPGQTHTGASSDGYAVWERNDDGTPVRWDPCASIELVVDASRAPEGAADDLAEAVRRLREASGLDLVIVGATDERPSGDREPYQPERYGDRWAPVLVAWASPHERGLPLRDTDRGVGIPVAVGPPGERTYVTGQVVLNADRTDLVAGFGDRAHSWGSTLLHELAHLVGLAHVDDPGQLLHVHPGTGPVRFGDGDLAGLRAVGGDHGCLRTPPPGPVEVHRP